MWSRKKGNFTDLFVSSVNIQMPFCECRVAIPVLTEKRTGVQSKRPTTVHIQAMFIFSSFLFPYFYHRCFCGNPTVQIFRRRRRRIQWIRREGGRAEDGWGAGGGRVPYIYKRYVICVTAVSVFSLHCIFSGRTTWRG